MNTSVCDTKWLGTLDYNTALSLQKSLHQQRANNQINDQLLFLEHRPVFTKGRRSKEEDFLETPSLLQTMGADIIETDRGGEITFHGPGQLVVYPIISIRRLKGPIQYVRMLEQCIIESLYEFNINSNCIEGLTGVWVGDNKIAAIGVKISNGISLHGGLIPFGGTFLVFSDYVKSAIRLSAIQKLHVLYEFTHDSIFVGEDGPTHQPVEHIMSLRLIPGLMVFRPADAVETQFCFEAIMKNNTNPSAILLTRQKLPLSNLDNESIKNGVKKGAYTIINHENPDAIIFTTGSELSLTLSIVASLEEKIKVVNMPCWELFEKQSKDYKKEILSHNCKKRISIEAGTTTGWEKFVGKDGLTVGINEFGHSAPGKDVAHKLDFTKEAIAYKIKEYLK